MLDLLILPLKVLRQLVWRLILKCKNALHWKPPQFQCSLKFLAHMNIFQQHFSGNKNPIFLACNLEQVYPAILEFLKNCDLFQNRQTYSSRIFEIPRKFLGMVSVWLQWNEDRGTSKDGRHLLVIACYKL